MPLIPISAKNNLFLLSCIQHHHTNVSTHARLLKLLPPSSRLHVTKLCVLSTMYKQSLPSTL